MSNQDNIGTAAFDEDTSDTETSMDYRMQERFSARVGGSAALGLRNPDRLANGLFVPPETRLRFEATNEALGYVTFGGKPRYVQAITSPEPYEWPYQFIDRAAAAEVMSGEAYAVLEKIEFRDGAPVRVKTRLPYFKAWCQWPGRRQYGRAGFYPGRREETVDHDEAIDRVFNIWEGWRVTPKPGCWHKMKRHIWEVVCRRDPRKFRWLISWLAHLVQTTGDPSRRSPVSPVIWGKKGGGKSIVFDYVARLFGRHGMTIAQRSQLVGKFNKHLMQALFVIAEEAVFARDRQIEGPLKDLLSRSTLTVEPKGVDAFEVPNYARFVFISNEELAVPMTEDERRYQPFEVSPHRIKDKRWFDDIIAEMDNGGLEAMFHDLMTMKCDEALIRRPIEDDADLLDMKGISAGPVERFLVDWFAAGSINLTDKSVFLTKLTGEGSIDGVLVLSETGPVRFKAEQLKAVYDAWCKESLDKWDLQHATRTKTKLVQELRKICPLIEDGRTATERGWLLPAMPKCRTWIAGELTLGRLYQIAVENLD